MLNEIGPLYGYFPNGAKTHILVKSQHIEKPRRYLKALQLTYLREESDTMEVQWVQPPSSRNLLRRKWKGG